MTDLTLETLRPGDLLELIDAPDWIRNTYARAAERIGVGEIFEVAEKCGHEGNGCNETGVAVRTQRSSNNLVFHPVEDDLRLFRKLT